MINVVAESVWKYLRYVSECNLKKCIFNHERTRRALE